MGIEPTTATANAIAETAKATGKAIDLVRDLGGFVGRVLGNAPENLVGVAVGDLLAEVRVRNAFRLAKRTDEILNGRGKKDTSTVSPSLAIPLLRAAEDESRPELQELWARLLANAMDPARTNDLRIEFIDALKRFHPRDALILQTMNDTPGQLGPNTRDYFVARLQLSQAAVLVSISNLIKLECVTRDTISSANFHMSDFGRQLIAACSL